MQPVSYHRCSAAMAACHTWGVQHCSRGRRAEPMGMAARPPESPPQTHHAAHPKALAPITCSAASAHTARVMASQLGAAIGRSMVPRRHRNSSLRAAMSAASAQRCSRWGPSGSSGIKRGRCAAASRTLSKCCSSSRRAWQAAAATSAAAAGRVGEGGQDSRAGSSGATRVQHACSLPV